ncbi:Phosphoenolpyruvate-protein phosphotransferase [Caprobacter fermentans]|uniref:Phosphoenolpyruvate-protein phosphotransferase n=1 Tax=Caproicibacter fermentans TaxID=2576756 RepID=A0A6N8HW89_9FIRM|nr:phosphoenolpyruvate--protein phosphotransferase [Caproicibacter fermentans]MVB09820.1 Phosphoenolpyruvate-protein phosphotransferase [Caproicibacter fermentans]OCN02057.1 phosphoenolpyruvate--protein phosphotransferase [Clostridium sp. W14A]
MTTTKGIGVSRGVAVGELWFRAAKITAIDPRAVADPEAEVKRFQDAKAKAIAQLAILYTQTEEKLGKENSILFQIHQMMLEDLDYNDSIVGIIREDRVCAEYAVQETAKKFADLFETMDDEYMRGRAADVKDVSERVVGILTGNGSGFNTGEKPCVLASDDLTPSETAQIDPKTVLAIVTSGGSPTSHTAIFARTMGIPAVVAVDGVSLQEYVGKTVAVDGSTGEIFIEPDAAVTKELARKEREQRELAERLERFRGKKTVTADGRAVDLYANIGGPQDMEAVLKSDAEGIGLFRSEFLFLKRSTLPTEEEQFQAYSSVVSKMNGKRVVIRTLDIGADKQAESFNLPKEENPAMGMRAIRICLTRPEIFKTQLRALYRASSFGNVAILLPMITSAEEIVQVKKICAEVKEELKRQEISFHPDVEIGIMIETPAAAVISDDLAPLVDFFSVGTNDLTQYTLAVDRQNKTIARFNNTHHKAVLRLLQTAADNAHRAGIWIGICGELAADESLTETFVKMGIDELSVAPSSVLSLRAKISEVCSV